ncbi:hypothetical protein ABPG72_008493 [Tetrahymena utriculariae]
MLLLQQSINQLKQLFTLEQQYIFSKKYRISMFGAADAKNQFICIPEFNTLAECKQTLTRYLMSQLKTIYSDTQRFFQNKYSAQTRNSNSCEYEERPFQILEDIGSLKNIYRHTGVMCFVFELLSVKILTTERNSLRQIGKTYMEINCLQYVQKTRFNIFLTRMLVRNIVDIIVINNPFA